MKLRLFSNNSLYSTNQFIYRLTPEDLPTPPSCSGKPGEKIPEPDSDYKRKLLKATMQVNANIGAMSDELAFQRLSSAIEPMKVERNDSGEYEGMKCAEGKERVATYLRDRTDVLVLQVLLKKLSAKYPKEKDLNPGKLDGFWGSDTKNAVKTFQAAARIKNDGEFGPETLGALKEVFAETKKLDFVSAKSEPAIYPIDGYKSLEYEKTEVIDPSYSYEIDGQKLAVKFVTDKNPVVYDIVAPMNFKFDIAKDPKDKQCVMVTDGSGNKAWFELDPNTPNNPRLKWGNVDGDKSGNEFWQKYRVSIPSSGKNTIEFSSKI